VATRRLAVDLPSGVDVVQADLTDLHQCRSAARGMDCVFHLAAVGGGLHANMKAQHEMFTANVLVNTNMLEASYREGVERYLLTSSSAVYDGDAGVLDDGQPWRSDPHPSEFGFGWAKRVAEIQARTYADACGMRIAIVRPSNPYGPRDNFDPEQSHVIPALIRRVQAGERPLSVWGTGKAIRSFIYVGDVADAMLLALEHDAVCDPVNIASGEQTSIADLARLILALCGVDPSMIEFDATKPEGHPGKFPKITKARDRISFVAQTSLRDGLEKTIRWLRETQRVPSGSQKSR
ncbi:MAG TPA: NAD-dependent epimerase/dehydratase family protein, partial [bacterium]|nr:NAD-dependent epimerase/dehydratase family protein [bacterium]